MNDGKTLVERLGDFRELSSDWSLLKATLEEAANRLEELEQYKER